MNRWTAIVSQPLQEKFARSYLLPTAGLSKLNCLQPDMYFSNPGDLTAYLNGNSGRAIDVYFKISLQSHK